jgi:hypothetical protein
MTTAKEILDSVKTPGEADTTSSLSKKGVLTASAIGAGLGIAIGYSRKYNLLISAFAGSVLFGLVANYYLKNK